MTEPHLDIRLLTPGKDIELEGDLIWEILAATDRDFVPALSARSDTTTKNLTAESLWGGPVAYFETVMKQHTLLATIDEKPAGLMSFIPHYEDDLLSDYSPSTYVSTTAVAPRARRKGVATALNAAIEHLPPELQDPYITRRTWSKNIANISLLESMGFQVVKRIDDHRGPGIDTLYFARTRIRQPEYRSSGL